MSRKANLCPCHQGGYSPPGRGAPSDYYGSIGGYGSPGTYGGQVSFGQMSWRGSQAQL